MCGLTGIAGSDIELFDINALRDLMRVSAVRGVDGTGLLQGYFKKKDDHQKSTYFVEKSTDDVNYFLYFHEQTVKGNQYVLWDIRDNVFAAHVRWATKGVIKQENSHPFDVGNVIGMHNGTLRDTKYSPKNGETDSELLLKDIEQRGGVPVLSDLQHDSAYALVWVEKDTGNLFFARNELRELHVAFNLDRKVMYWHSEKQALEWILDRNNINHSDVYYFEPHVLHCIHPMDITKNGKFKKTEKIAVKPTPPVVVKIGGEAWSYTGKKDQDYYDDIPFGHNISTPEEKEVAKKVVKNLFKFERKKAAIVIYYECIGCSKKLSLYEQYKAQKTTTSEDILIHLCEDCVEMTAAIETTYKKEEKDAL